jgi:multidrug efflux pump subunit AcrA (membrane-fusion protein)
MKRTDSSAEPPFRLRRELATTGSKQLIDRKSWRVFFLPRISMVTLGCSLAMIALSGCSDEADVAKTAGNDTETFIPELVAQTLTIEPLPWPTIVRCQGTLYADEHSAIGARVAGRVATVHVDLGDSVKAGEPLVTLESDEFELLVSQVEAQLNQARSAVGLTGSEVNDSLDPENSPPV